MKTIKIGNDFRIYDDTLQVFDMLPSQAYIVRFSPRSGFYLEVYSEISVNDEKIYGVHLKKIEKVLRAFNNTDRNLGVILSGDKGIGKSLFAKVLATRAIENDLPLIIVDSYIPGIASYLEEIKQKVMVLFDEYDKTFGGIRARDGDADPQTELLTLFDGVAQGKKLFVITCNEIRLLNSFLVNRPGRFHYHFRFSYPSAEEVREYLEDKLEESYKKEINKVIDFVSKVNLNYDCLRAIAFELNTGETFEQAIEDLNIMNLVSEEYYAELHFSNGMVVKKSTVCLDLFKQEESIDFYYNKLNLNFEVYFETSQIEYIPASGRSIIRGESLRIEYDDYADDDADEDDDNNGSEMNKWIPSHVLIKKKVADNLHYTV